MGMDIGSLDDLQKEVMPILRKTYEGFKAKTDA
jgi:hypothetical protein